MIQLCLYSLNLDIFGKGYFHFLFNFSSEDRELVYIIGVFLILNSTASPSEIGLFIAHPVQTFLVIFELIHLSRLHLICILGHPYQVI